MKKISFDLQYIIHLLTKYWIVVICCAFIGIISAFIFNKLVTPLYRSNISLFTWNRNIVDALENVKKENKSKSQEIMLYNNIVSQSLYLGERLINDYKTLIKNPHVLEATDQALFKKGFKRPLKYKFNCSIKPRSCIMNISVDSPDPELASAAAESIVQSFKDEQKRLMSLKYIEAIHKATRPKSPFFPNNQLNLILGLIFGFILGGSVALFLDLRDTTVKKPEDLKERGLLPLGVIPFYPNINQLCKQQDSSKFNRQENSILDVVRIITTTISFLKLDDPPKVIQFTSALPSVGKSTQVLLLSRILGAADKKVLIIDCDLRRPKIYSNLGLKEYSGMVNYLADSECSNPQKYIQTNVFPNVDIMTHGIIPPNPTEVLGTKKFMSLLEKLKDEYDNILLDGPPSCGMADAMVLAKSTDAILMIVECGKTKINDIMKTMEQFGTLQEKILGAILNKADIRKTNDYYYSYGYYYQSNTKPATNIPSIKEIDRKLT